MSSNDPNERLNALRALLQEGQISTQEELVKALHAQQFMVTQSTISRDLSRLGAIKTRNSAGEVIYRLPEEPPVVSGEMKGLLIKVQHNGSLIILQTTPGSASLVARHLDRSQMEGILGTIAGDDTVFVAPISSNEINNVAQSIINEF